MGAFFVFGPLNRSGPFRPFRRFSMLIRRLLGERDLEALGPLPDLLPNLWYGAPHPALVRLRDAVRSGTLFPYESADLCGRTGAGLFVGPRGVEVVLAHEPFREPERDPGCALPLAERLAGTVEASAFEFAAKTTELVDARGESFRLFDFAEALFAAKPLKIARGGGAGLNLTRAHWMRALLDAPRAPAPRILNAAHAAGAGRLRLYGEWWEGPSPVFDVKHPLMWLAPRTTVKPLVERLLADTPAAADPRLTDPRVLAKRPEIVAQTDDWVVIVKPSGLLSVPGTLGLDDAMTLTARMIGEAQGTGTDSVSLTPVHRLDMDTSGLLVYSKNPDATRALMAAFREGRVEKRYEAILEGVLDPKAADSGEIAFPLTTHPLDRLRQCAAEGGRASVTRYAVLARGRERTHVALEPVTGRTHQLRLHAAHPLGLGTPILGDPYYGPAGLAAETPETPLRLHARLLSFEDPRTGERLRFEVPAPFEELLV